MAGLPPQPVSVPTTVPALVLLSVSFGSARTPVRSKSESVGPVPRTRTDCAPDTPDPPMTNPAVMMLVPVPTWARQERFVRRPGFDEAATASVAGLLVAVPEELVATQV